MDSSHSYLIKHSFCYYCESDVVISQLQSLISKIFLFQFSHIFLMEFIKVIAVIKLLTVIITIMKKGVTEHFSYCCYMLYHYLLRSQFIYYHYFSISFNLCCCYYLDSLVYLILIFKKLAIISCYYLFQIVINLIYDLLIY